MSVRFILGRSGSGKTHACLEAIRKALSTSGRGDPLILLVPEQATFQMEQALVADDQLTGYSRAHVVSFERLARLILQASSPATLPILSETAKQMILRRLLQEQRDHLSVFSLSADRSGFVVKLGEMISECRHYQKTPQQVSQQGEKLAQSGQPHLQPLAKKLLDLSRIYHAYQDYVTDRFVDPDDILDQMIRCCPQAPLLRQANLWIDGFAGFTPQQYSTVAALVAHVQHAQLSLCLDPHSRAFQKAQRSDVFCDADRLDLFHPTLATFGRLEKLFQESATEILPSLLLPENPTAEASLPRYQDSEQLARLEQNIFSPGSWSGPPDRTPDHNERQPSAPFPEELPTRDIALLRAPNRRREVDAVAGQIVRLCRDHGYRFRDIAVILRDFSDYQPLLEASFADYGIAYFMDQRRSVSHHPLVELLRWAVQTLAGDFKSPDVLNYLKTDLASLPDDAVFALENFVLAHGVDSSRWYARDPWQNNQDARAAQEIDADRRRAVGPLLEMRTQIAGTVSHEMQPATVLQISTALFGLLEALEVQATLSDWTRQAQQEGDLDLAHTHQQVYQDVINLLDDLVAAMGESVVSLDHYGELLNAALSQMSLGLIPPALDQVLIGAIERSRHPQIRAAFVLGVNEGKFPRVAGPDSFFTDDQRRHLLDDGFELAPGRTDRLLDERYLAYIALTRARDFLWVSFPVAGEAGNELHPSLLVENIQDALGDVQVIELRDAHTPEAAGIGTVGQLARQVALALSPQGAPAAEQGFWKQLGRKALDRPEWHDTISRSLAGLTYHNYAVLDAQVIDQLFPAPLLSSVSRLESYAACPFQHFAKHTLKLKERDVLALRPMDVGTFYHAALFSAFKTLQSRRHTWSDLSAGELTALIDEVCRDLTTNDPQFVRFRQQSHRNRFILEKASRNVLLLCRGIWRAAGAGNFCQCEAELEFGADKPLPALELTLGPDRTLQLRGKIDRVDVCQASDGNGAVCVIDYKTSGQTFTFDLFFHGLSLQLMSYLLVLEKHYRPNGGTKPAAAAVLYIPIHRQGKTQPGPAPEEVGSGRNLDDIAPPKATGLISGDWALQLDRSLEPPQRSQFFNFYLNKEGSVYTKKNQRVVHPQEMAALLDYGEKTLIRLAQELISGRIDISPYRHKQTTPCTHCEFSSLCRFDVRSDAYRQLAPMGRDAVLERLETQGTGECAQ